jgi:glycosyltransferase involved in cell wall biosynthesis
MRTLIFSFPFSSALGGGERYLEQVIDGLLGLGFTFTLISSSRAMLGVFRRRSWDRRPLWCGIEPVSGLAVLLFPLTAALFLPIFIVLLIGFRVVGGARAVICLSLTDKLLATAPARLLGMKVIWIEHLIPGRSLLLNPYRPLYALLSRLALVVTVSEAVRKSLTAVGVRSRGIRVIPPGFEAGLSCGPAERPVIGVVSRLSGEKNIELAVRSFARVLKTVPEASLSIFGEGRLRGDLERLAEKLGVADRVVFRGYVEDKASLYGGLRVLAVPSLRESFGIAALEAMGCGVPVVATSVGGLPEVVADGETGIIVPDGDEAAFAEALCKLLTDRDLAERLGAAGRERAARQFNIQKTVSAWEETLNPAHAHPHLA